MDAVFGGGGGGGGAAAARKCQQKQYMRTVMRYTATPDWT